MLGLKGRYIENGRSGGERARRQGRNRAIKKKSFSPPGTSQKARKKKNAKDLPRARCARRVGKRGTKEVHVHGVHQTRRLRALRGKKRKGRGVRKIEGYLRRRPARSREKERGKDQKCLRACRGNGGAAFSGNEGKRRS